MPAHKPFDPFGDFDQAGYLRNLEGLKDSEAIKKLEHASFLANLGDAVEVLRSSKAIIYQSFLDTHRILFGDFHPWAGRDRVEVAPDLMIRKGNVRFAVGADIRRAIDYGLALAKANGVRQAPGTIMGYFAHGHPFLDGNGRTMMLVFGELCFREGFSIAWERTDKTDYLAALTDELVRPDKGVLDTYLSGFIAPPIPHDRYSKTLEELPGLDGLDRFLDENLEIEGYTTDLAAAKAYEAAMRGRYSAYQADANSKVDDQNRSD